ncbi:hypothetical protein [Streptomyces sp. NPDC054804]
MPGLDLRPGRQLVLDLSGITFCDSSGITTLIPSRLSGNSRRRG